MFLDIFGANILGSLLAAVTFAICCPFTITTMAFEIFQIATATLEDPLLHSA